MARGVEKLHPELIIIAREFESRCKAEGLNVLITETLRTKQEQDDLYAQGRTKPGKIVTNVKYPDSYHCWGMAFDFCRNKRGYEYDDSDNFFRRCGNIGKGMKLVWGGDWIKQDKPHFQYIKYDIKNLKIKYKSFEAFKNTWASTDISKGDIYMEKRYETIAEIPEWARATVQKIIDKGYISGNSEKKLNLSEDMLRLFVINDRAGIY